MLLTACEQFLGKSETEIQHIALVTLEGHQRAIMGQMTVEDIYRVIDRAMSTHILCLFANFSFNRTFNLHFYRIARSSASKSLRWLHRTWLIWAFLLCHTP